MLDIRLLRDDAEGVKERLKARGGDAWELVDEVLACDEERRAGETERQALQNERNTVSKEIGKLKKAGEDTSEIEARVRGIGEQIKAIGEKADAAETRQNELLLGIPNLPHADCPVGDDEDANPVLREWGEKPSFADGYEPQEHLEIGERLGLFSFELGAKIGASGFVCFTGQGAKLQRALIQFLLDVHTTEHGYQEVNPSIIVNRDCMFGTGQLPKFEDDLYGLEDNAYFLSPTAEVPVTNLYRESIVDAGEFPIKTTAASHCFRREAGAAGRHTRGLIRMHQFDKVELVNVVHPDESFAQLDTLTQEAEIVLQKLGLHYRVIELCTGDLGFVAAKTFDIELWAPGYGDYLEVSSCSNFVDYQARRMKLRFKDENGKNRFCHTLNGSGTALARLYVACIESWQQADGTLAIPEILQPYFGADSIG